MAKKTPAQILAMHKGPNSKFSKNQVQQAAHDLGSLGGQIGGPARAAALSAKRLSEISRHAAYQRWGKSCPPSYRCPYC